MSQRLTLDPSPRQQACDLCAAADFQVVARCDRRGKPLTTVVCRRCGLVSHEQIPDDEALDHYYRLQYRQDYHGELTPAPHRVVRAWEGGRWLFRQLQPHVPHGSRVCEIGAGIGCTLKAFELAGFDVEGIEPGIGFHRFAAERLRVPIRSCQLLDLPAQPAFDFVLLVHVIEHFNSPRRALCHIRSLLRENGRLYVECPNLGAPHAAPGKEFHIAHIYNFTHDTLEMLAQQCGFEVVCWLTDREDRALRVVLRRAAGVKSPIVPESYARTLAALGRYSSLGYHLRPRYWLDRIQRDTRFLSHHWFARRRLQRILGQCQQPRPAGRGTLLAAG